jgi:hypothetical protein
MEGTQPQADAVKSLEALERIADALTLLALEVPAQSNDPRAFGDERRAAATAVYNRIVQRENQ